MHTYKALLNLAPLTIKNLIATLSLGNLLEWPTQAVPCSRIGIVGVMTGAGIKNCDLIKAILQSLRMTNIEDLEEFPSLPSSSREMLALICAGILGDPGLVYTPTVPPSPVELASLK